MEYRNKQLNFRVTQAEYQTIKRRMRKVYLAYGRKRMEIIRNKNDIELEIVA